MRCEYCNCTLDGIDGDISETRDGKSVFFCSTNHKRAWDEDQVNLYC